MLLYDYRTETLQALLLLLLFIFRRKLGDISDSLEKHAKDHAVKIVVTLIALVLFVTLDDPLFILSGINQFFIAFFLIVIVYFTWIKKGAGYVYDKKINSD